ncbi:hypothetical protein Hamer_G021627 [Homarus americanus]|uniref:Uncharacterized protein n=1 Tax=Homarus americanus TaxID=6706 RepID=A0A8J5JLS6_HOMAM|nr:hypothetical protein Hamer_G021627 [Homarus americanus]
MSDGRGCHQVLGRSRVLLPPPLPADCRSSGPARLRCRGTEVYDGLVGSRAERPGTPALRPRFGVPAVNALTQASLGKRTVDQAVFPMTVKSSGRTQAHLPLPDLANVTLHMTGGRSVQPRAVTQ